MSYIRALCLPSPLRLVLSPDPTLKRRGKSLVILGHFFGLAVAAALDLYITALEFYLNFLSMPLVQDSSPVYSNIMSHDRSESGLEKD